MDPAAPASTACQSNSSSQRVEPQHRFEQTSRNNQHETNQRLKCADTVDSKHHTEENVKHEEQHATNARKKGHFAVICQSKTAKIVQSIEQDHSQNGGDDDPQTSYKSSTR